jgi:hypothetical protein
MKVADIKEPHVYHYSRKLRGVTITGTGRVIQVYRALNGWHVIVHDAKNRRAPTLRPAHILRPVRVR